jgi:hypothetical protein
MGLRFRVAKYILAVTINGTRVTTPQMGAIINKARICGKYLEIK